MQETPPFYVLSYAKTFFEWPYIKLDIAYAANSEKTTPVLLKNFARDWTGAAMKQGQFWCALRTDSWMYGQTDSSSFWDAFQAIFVSKTRPETPKTLFCNWKTNRPTSPRANRRPDRSYATCTRLRWHTSSLWPCFLESSRKSSLAHSELGSLSSLWPLLTFLTSLVSAFCHHYSHF